MVLQTLCPSFTRSTYRLLSFVSQDLTLIDFCLHSYVGELVVVGARKGQTCSTVLPKKSRTLFLNDTVMIKTVKTACGLYCCKGWAALRLSATTKHVVPSAVVMVFHVSNLIFLKSGPRQYRKKPADVHGMPCTLVK